MVEVGRTTTNLGLKSEIAFLCFTYIETLVVVFFFFVFFFLNQKKFRIIFSYFYAQNRGVRFC